jgi:hypothetical protein
MILFALFFPKNLSDANVVSESSSRSISSATLIDIYLLSFAAIIIESIKSMEKPVRRNEGAQLLVPISMPADLVGGFSSS